MAGCMAGQQGNTPESLDRLALSRLDGWRKAHPTAGSFQASKADTRLPLTALMLHGKQQA